MIRLWDLVGSFSMHGVQSVARINKYVLLRGHCAYDIGQSVISLRTYKNYCVYLYLKYNSNDMVLISSSLWLS